MQNYQKGLFGQENAEIWAYRLELWPFFISKSSHFAGNARRAFPCFDEPDKKAYFDVQLGHLKSMTALSNMPQKGASEEIEDKPNYVLDTFETSVKMSTYLLAFLVADFGSTSSADFAAFKIWHQKSKDLQAEYAANVGPKILKFYDEYFGLPYPLPKMDVAAIPDFRPGAMENWGLVFHKEIRLLLDSNSSAATDKESVTVSMAHELAHQWFGNLVTLKWWNDVWLNEGG